METAPLKKVYAWIMAGGVGERFWPLSRTSTPKHLLKLFSEKTMLELTLDRLHGIIPDEHVFILTQQEQLQAIRSVLPHFPIDHIVVEPQRRDTAPAITLATALTGKKDEDACVIFLPADALIKNVEVFKRQLRDAIDLANETNALATISIRPTHPSTHFGYLQTGNVLREGSCGSRCFEVVRFIEKPDLAKARAYVESGHYEWNAGIFVWKISTFQRELECLQPELAGFMKQVIQTHDLSTALNNHFALLPRISIDYALMEKAKRVVTVESQFDWDDVGSWTAIPAHFDKDENGNVLLGQAALLNAKRNIIHNKTDKVVALCGVEDLVVVQTDDALLVCHRNALGDMKKLHALLPPQVT